MSAKRKVPTTLAKPVVKPSAKAPIRTKIDETRTAVTTGHSSQPGSGAAIEPIEISSDSSSNYDDLDDEEKAEDDAQGGADADEDKQIIARRDEQASGSQKTPPPEVTRLAPKPNPGEGANAEVLAPKEDDDPEADASDAEPASPTFGELIRGNSTVDVAASLALQQATPLSPLSAPQPKAFAPVSHSSLGTVLNQALRTDDYDLLESCLQVNDHDVVMNTINRLESPLAGALLSKLASRLHRRPGRALSLMKWIQGTLIAHGGALATQPDLFHKLSDLNRVLDERSRGLNSLLALKGKLDMLDAQLKIRKMNRASGANRRTALLRGAADDEEGMEDEEEEEEEGVIYVEGQEDGAHSQANGVADDEDEFPITNGFGGDSEEGSDEDEDEDDERGEEVFDEAGSLDEDEIDHDDIEESGEEDDSEEETARPPNKVRKVAPGFAKRK